MKNKKIVIEYAVIFLLLSVLIMCIRNDNGTFDIIYKGEANPRVVPVLYYESNIGNEDYLTSTFLLYGSQKKELDEHRRSFSKTYPVVALENESYNLKTYGQLLSYYNLSDGKFYIFDSSVIDPEQREFTLYLNEFVTTIEYSKNEYFFLALCYGDTYYVLCLDQKDENYADFDTLNIYSFTSQLKKNKQTNIDLRKLGIKSHNIINKSIAISDENIIIPVKKEGEYYFLTYNFSTTKLIHEKKNYNIVGAISELDTYLLVGFNKNNLIIERISASSGETISEQNIDLDIRFNKLIDRQIEFDDILYLFNNRIYMSYYYLDATFYLSVDCNDWNKKSLWKVQNNNDEMILMDCKFMVLSQGKYYDIYPNTVVSG